ncbi:MAG: MerR family transcriptional regulator [Gammaproteobacteria bacterium]|nr:MerR family transcriptional regulator [Caldilineaceae bacterium]MCB1925737.1 MerR family transcriptional regulator [Gammaproteobacteria bacterium]
MMTDSGSDPLWQRFDVATEALGTPRFVASDVCAIAEIDDDTLYRWLSRELAHQNIGVLRGHRRLFRGSDVLALAVIRRLSRLGVPIARAALLVPYMRRRAEALMTGTAVGTGYTLLLQPSSDGYDWQIDGLCEGDAVPSNLALGFVVLRADDMIRHVVQFLGSVR